MENQRPLLVGLLSTPCSSGTEVAKWAAPRCSRPEPATDISVRGGRSRSN